MAVRQRFDEVQGQAVVVESLADRFQGGLADLGLRFLTNLTRHSLDELTALVKTRLNRMQYRPGLIDGLDFQAP
ncbi:hypothetical protein [Streptomyces sp. NPDC096142]|uniref:hypothetical protein n=1 Tax=Streptomyces sp. NPDC096142 TaxID=3366077 RepID=UPI0038088FBF